MLRNTGLLLCLAAATCSALPHPTEVCVKEGGFELVGHVHSTVVAPSDSSCCGECQIFPPGSTSWCVGWTYKDGACHLYDEITGIKANPKTSAARKFFYSGSGDDSGAVYQDVDLAGGDNDLGSVSNVPRTRDCSTKCVEKPGCRAYSYNSYNNGTCWLKKVGVEKYASVKATYKPGVKSANLYPTGYYETPSIPAFEDATDYVANDIGHQNGTAVDKCGAACIKFSGCKAFSWNTYESGSCWFKSARGQTKANKDVTSAVIVAPVPQWTA